MYTGSGPVWSTGGGDGTLNPMHDDTEFAFSGCILHEPDRLTSKLTSTKPRLGRASQVAKSFFLPCPRVTWIRATAAEGCLCL